MGMVHGPNLVTDGLVVYLDAGNVQSYPGSGTTWYDLSGKGHFATLAGGATYTQPKAGLSYAITLDGVNDYINGTTLPGGDDSFTIDLWVYHNGTDQGASYGVYSGGNNYGPLLYSHGTGMATSMYFPSSPAGSYFGNYASTTNLDWCHYVHILTNTLASANGTYASYKDGLLKGTITADLHNSGHGRGSNGYTLGGYLLNSNPYKGSFGSFKYYNRALTAAEVLQNYNAHKSRFGL